MSESPRRPRASEIARALRMRLELDRQMGLDAARRPTAATPARATPRTAASPAPTTAARGPASKSAPASAPRAPRARTAPPPAAPVAPAPATEPAPARPVSTPALVDPATLSPKGLRLRAIQEPALVCRRCPLCESRIQVVFGVGNPDTTLLFVGEAPGADEDEQGEPFVGRAGKLLDQVLAEVGITRAQIYIANTIKCRPPGNRTPAPAEIEACAPWLQQQIEVVAPRLIVTLGNVSTKALLKTETGIMRLRGRQQMWGDIPVIPTMHPAYLLRNPPDMAKWREDFQVIAAAWRALQA